MMIRSLLIVSFFVNLFSVYGQTEKKEYFAFVGEKISVSVKQTGSVKLDTTNIITNSNDTVFLLQMNKNVLSAVYKIVKPISGSYLSDTIMFIVYDEFEYPDFTEHEHVLFFLEKRGPGEYFLLSNYYVDVYKTEDDCWAGDYSLLGWYINLFEKFKLKIEFKESVYFDISGLDGNHISRYYPSLYYKIDGNHAIPIYGIYANDLPKLLINESSLHEGTSK